jgi:methionine aminopeptidase
MLRDPRASRSSMPRRSRAAHVEHTVAITDDGAVVLTAPA